MDGEVVQHATLSEPELRYRQRYADLAVNPEVREIFRIRAATVRALREFMDSHGFLEVETPILQPIYGGAAARPFVTHHNQLKQDLYLRISFELVPQAPAGGRFRTRLRDRARFPQRRRGPHAQPRIHADSSSIWAYADY